MRSVASGPVPSSQRSRHLNRCKAGSSRSSTTTIHPQIPPEAAVERHAFSRLASGAWSPASRGTVESAQSLAGSRGLQGERSRNQHAARRTVPTHEESQLLSSACSDSSISMSSRPVPRQPPRSSKHMQDASTCGSTGQDKQSDDGKVRRGMGLRVAGGIRAFDTRSPEINRIGHQPGELLYSHGLTHHLTAGRAGTPSWKHTPRCKAHVSRTQESVPQPRQGTRGLGVRHPLSMSTIDTLVFNRDVDLSGDDPWEGVSWGDSAGKASTHETPRGKRLACASPSKKGMIGSVAFGQRYEHAALMQSKDFSSARSSLGSGFDNAAGCPSLTSRGWNFTHQLDASGAADAGPYRRGIKTVQRPASARSSTSSRNSSFFEMYGRKRILHGHELDAGEKAGVTSRSLGARQLKDEGHVPTEADLLSRHSASRCDVQDLDTLQSGFSTPRGSECRSRSCTEVGSISRRSGSAPPLRRTGYR